MYNLKGIDFSQSIQMRQYSLPTNNVSSLGLKDMFLKIESNYQGIVSNLKSHISICLSLYEKQYDLFVRDIVKMYPKHSIWSKRNMLDYTVRAEYDDGPLVRFGRISVNLVPVNENKDTIDVLGRILSTGVLA